MSGKKINFLYIAFSCVLFSSLPTKPNPLHLLSRRLSHASEKNKRRPKDGEEWRGRELGIDPRSWLVCLLPHKIGWSSCFPLNSVPLIVVLDGDVMRGVDQVDGGVMVGNRRKDEGKMRGQSLRILVVLAVWVRSHFYLLF